MSTLDDLSIEDNVQQPVDMDLTCNVPPVNTSLQQVMSPPLSYCHETVIQLSLALCSPMLDPLHHHFLNNAP